MVNGFLETVCNVRNGGSASELEEALVKVIAAVRETGKRGSITYTLAIAPASAGDSDTLIATDRIAVKVPELSRAATVFFATPDGMMSRNNVKQPELGGFREVPAAISEVREVGAAAAIEALKDPDGTGQTTVSHRRLDGAVEVLAGPGVAASRVE